MAQFPRSIGEERPARQLPEDHKVVERLDAAVARALYEHLRQVAETEEEFQRRERGRSAGGKSERNRRVA